MKKIICITLVLLVILTASIALVACDGNNIGGNKDEWKSMTDGSTGRDVVAWRVKQNAWTGADYWEVEFMPSSIADKIKQNNLPIDMYHIVNFNVHIPRNNIAMIKFTIVVEEEMDFTYRLGDLELKTNHLRAGENELIFGYEYDILRRQDERLFEICVPKEYAGIRWTVKDIKYRPIK